jgi:transcriptional regulator NrdR family protein
MTCPGCDSTTSSVLAAVERGEGCPYCGLSAETIERMQNVWERFGETVLTEQLAAALKRAEVAEREADGLRAKLRRIVEAVRSAEAAA